MLLFYIRHGQPIYEPDSLTPLGLRQAEAVARRLAMFGLDEIYSSDSMRAYQTACPTAELLGKEITQLHWCNESVIAEVYWRDLSDGRRGWIYQDKAICKKFVSPEVTTLGDRWYTHPDFTQYADGTKRIQNDSRGFIQSLGYAYDGKTNTYRGIKPSDRRIALFAHEGAGMAFLSSTLGIPYPMFCTHFGLQHSGVSVIRFSGEENVIPQLLQLSNDSHLYKDGLPLSYNDEIRI